MSESFEVGGQAALLLRELKSKLVTLPECEFDSALAAIEEFSGEMPMGNQQSAGYQDTVYQDRYQDTNYDDHYADAPSYRDAAR